MRPVPSEESIFLRDGIAELSVRYLVYADDVLVDESDDLAARRLKNVAIGLPNDLARAEAGRPFSKSRRFMGGNCDTTSRAQDRKKGRACHFCQVMHRPPYVKLIPSLTEPNEAALTNLQSGLSFYLVL